MNSQMPNVINPKSLEKQLKLVEGRIAEVRGELHELEKMRTACLILLGGTADFEQAEVGSDAKPPADNAPAKSGRRKTEKKTSEFDAAAEPETESEEPLEEEAESAVAPGNA